MPANPVFGFHVMGVCYPITRVSSALLQTEFYSAHTPVGNIVVTVAHHVILQSPQINVQEIVERAFRQKERQWNGLGDYLIGVLDDDANF